MADGLHPTHGDGAPGGVAVLLPAPPPGEQAREDERRRAEHVHAEVLAVLTKHYASHELPDWLKAAEAVHRKRVARLAFGEARRQGKTAEEAIADTADAVLRSEGWVRGVVYPGQRRS